MWKRALFLCLALSVGLAVAYDVNDYSYSLRGNDVMAMSECVPDEMMGVPQPKPMECTVTCCGHHEWVPFMERGPVRRFFRHRRPVRQFFGWLFRVGHWRR